MCKFYYTYIYPLNHTRIHPPPSQTHTHVMINLHILEIVLLSDKTSHFVQINKLSNYSLRQNVERMRYCQIRKGEGKKKKIVTKG